MKLKKRIKKFFALAIACSAIPLNTEADPILGNAPTTGNAFSIAFEGGNTWGAAIAFTPQLDVNFFSVTLWLTGYNGQNGQSMCAGIWSDATQLDPAFSSQPAVDLAYLSPPAPNDGSLAAFTFDELSAPSVLHADTKYWLFIYGTGDLSGSFLSWAQGSPPTGNAFYNGADVFAGGSFAPADSLIPAFTINGVSSNVSTVPEPATVGLAGISVAVLLILRARK